MLYCVYLFLCPGTQKEYCMQEILGQWPHLSLILYLDYSEFKINKRQIVLGMKPDTVQSLSPTVTGVLSMAFYSSFYPLVQLSHRVNSCDYCLVSIAPRFLASLIFQQSHFPNVFILSLLVFLQCILHWLLESGSLLSSILV